MNDPITDYSLRELQSQQDIWSDQQGWERGDGTLAALGVIEEVGELIEALGYPPDSDPDLVKAFEMMISIGRFAHSTLKRIQGIRGTEQQHRNDANFSLAYLNRATRQDWLFAAEQGRPINDEAARDASGDMLIYLMDVANRKGWDIEDVLNRTYEEVFSREWKKFPLDGKTA